MNRVLWSRCFQCIFRDVLAYGRMCECDSHLHGYQLISSTKNIFGVKIRPFAAHAEHLKYTKIFYFKAQILLSCCSECQRLQCLRFAVHSVRICMFVIIHGRNISATSVWFVDLFLSTEPFAFLQKWFLFLESMHRRPNAFGDVKKWKTIRIHCEMQCW